MLPGFGAMPLRRELASLFRRDSAKLRAALSAAAAGANSDITHGVSMVLLGSVTAAASATINFDATVIGNYSEIFFMLEDVKLSVDGTSLGLRQSHDNGATVQVTNYAFHRSALDSSSATYLASVTASGAEIVLGVFGNDTSETISGQVRLSNPASATGFKKILWDMGGSTTSGAVVRCAGAGLCKTLETAVNYIRFLPASGTITSGTIRAYGIRK